MKLNLGCGSQAPDGWVNVDYSLGAQFAKIPLFTMINRKLKLFDLNWDSRIYIHDLTKRFPWTDGSIDVVYSSFVLEYFTRDEGRTFLTECHRVLKKDGLIRMLIWDLRYIVNEYVTGKLPADDFIGELCVLQGHHANRIKNQLYPFIQFPAKCMYDATRLIEILNDIGFTTISKNAFESEIDDITRIEQQCTEDVVIVEGRKR